eukprot:scaffold33967_cov155-Skeletonema_dohrnii-CCMP3373.AAC.1
MDGYLISGGRFSGGRAIRLVGGISPAQKENHHQRATAHQPPPPPTMSHQVGTPTLALLVICSEWT